MSLLFIIKKKKAWDNFNVDEVIDGIKPKFKIPLITKTFKLTDETLAHEIMPTIQSCIEFDPISRPSTENLEFFFFKLKKSI